MLSSLTESQEPFCWGANCREGIKGEKKGHPKMSNHPQSYSTPAIKVQDWQMSSSIALNCSVTALFEWLLSSPLLFDNPLRVCIFGLVQSGFLPHSFFVSFRSTLIFSLA
jgi:hypothetical protein